MLKNVFLKTLYEKRTMTLFWFIGMFLMVLLTMSVYPSFSQDGGLSDALGSVPDALKGIIGDLELQKTIGGFIDQQIMAFRMPLFMIIYGIILFNSLLAGDESEGTLQTLMVQPVSRFRVLSQKALAGATLSAITSFATFAGLFIGLMMVGENYSLMKISLSTLNLWLLTVCFGVLTMAIGAIAGNKSLASTIVGLFAFTNYFVTSLTPNVDWLSPFEKLTIIYYYAEPAVTLNGFEFSKLLVIILLSVAFFAIGAWRFNKRDIYQT